MKKSIIAALAVGLVVIVAFSAVQYVSSAELFPYQKTLSFMTIEQSDDAMEYRYYGNASDGKIAVASINVRVEQDFNNQRRVRVDLYHAGNTELDSVKLKFQSNDITDVYFKGYTATTYSTSRTLQSFNSAVIYDKTLGEKQASTPLEFIVSTKGDSNFSVYLEVDLCMHYKQPLELTQLTASAGLNINLQ